MLTWFVPFRTEVVLGIKVQYARGRVLHRAEYAERHCELALANTRNTCDLLSTATRSSTVGVTHVECDSFSTPDITLNLIRSDTPQ